MACDRSPYGAAPTAWRWGDMGDMRHWGDLGDVIGEVKGTWPVSSSVPLVVVSVGDPCYGDVNVIARKPAGCSHLTGWRPMDAK